MMTNDHVFIDTNFIISLLDDHSSLHQKATDLYNTLLKTGYQGVINPYIINELHNYYLRNYDYKTTNWVIKQILQGKEFHYHDSEFDQNDIRKILDISNRYNLRTFDSYNAYYCKKVGIKKIATFDEEFDKVKFLKRIN